MKKLIKKCTSLVVLLALLAVVLPTANNSANNSVETCSMGDKDIEEDIITRQ